METGSKKGTRHPGGQEKFNSLLQCIRNLLESISSLVPFSFFFYIHTWHSLTKQLHILKYKYGTYLQQDYKIYLRDTLLLTYIKIPKTKGLLMTISK